MIIHFLIRLPVSGMLTEGNSFYLIDHECKIPGVLRLANPSKFSLTDRIGNLHLEDILNMPGNNWISFVGLKDEVFVILGRYEQLKWSKNYWLLRDRSIVFDLLDRFDFAPELRQIFVSIVITLSELKFGSIILIPENEKILPPHHREN